MGTTTAFRAVVRRTLQKRDVFFSKKGSRLTYNILPFICTVTGGPHGDGGDTSSKNKAMAAVAAGYFLPSARSRARQYNRL